MWGTIIGAGISAIGSLLGSDDDEKETVTRSEVDYVKMAQNAEKAGFNPLTAMRNGGSAGFSTSTTTHPGLSSMAGIGAAIGTIGNALMSFDPRADERADLEERMMRAQLARIEGGGTGQSMWSMDVPTAAKSTAVNAMGQSVSKLAPPPIALNVSRNLGTFTKAPFEPVTEWDELVAGTDQILSDLQRAGMTPPKDDSSTWRKLFVTPSGVSGDSPRHWNLPANRGW